MILEVIEMAVKASDNIKYFHNSNGRAITTVARLFGLGC